jgi:hypothetical protein
LDGSTDINLNGFLGNQLKNDVTRDDSSEPAVPVIPNTGCAVLFFFWIASKVLPQHLENFQLLI